MGLCLRRLLLQYPPVGVAGFTRNQWQLSIGISGKLRLESVAGFARNQWQASIGIRNYLRRQRLDSLDQPRAEGLHAGVVGFRKGTAGIRAAARKEDTGLSVLAQHQGSATVRAVGGQAIGRLGLRSLGQLNGQRRHGQDPPTWGLPHARMIRLYHLRDVAGVRTPPGVGERWRSVPPGGQRAAPDSGWGIPGIVHWLLLDSRGVGFADVVQPNC